MTNVLRALGEQKPVEIRGRSDYIPQTVSGVAYVIAIFKHVCH
jgi:hypothetical protein